MQKYNIVFARSAVKEIEGLPDPAKTRIFLKISTLSANPRPSGVKKIRGENDLWRVRIGDYRVIYSIDDLKLIVDVILIRHRKDVYR